MHVYTCACVLVQQDAIKVQKGHCSLSLDAILLLLYLGLSEDRNEIRIARKALLQLIIWV